MTADASLAVLVKVTPRRGFVGEPQGASPAGKLDRDGPNRRLRAVLLKPRRCHWLGENCRYVWCMFAHRFKC
jgi:hypothetical protein